MINLDWETIYKSSLFAFRCAAEDWVRFTLNGEAGSLPADIASPVKEFGSLTILTAWNPMSKELPLSVNEEANAALCHRFESSGLAYGESYGCSLPGVTPEWREDGFVIYGLSREEAVEWGFSVCQRAIVFADAKGIGLLFCSDGRFVPCGAEQPDA